MDKFKPIPVDEARYLSDTYGKAEVMIIAFDEDHQLLSATTYGQSMVNKKHIAKSSEYVMGILGADLNQREIFEDDLNLLS